MHYRNGRPQIGDAATPLVAYTAGDPRAPTAIVTGIGRKAAPKVVVTALGRQGGPGRSEAEIQAVRADQAGICASAARARASQSPAYGSLSAQCAARRRENVASLVYVPDDMTPNDPAYRVALEAAGEQVIGGDAALQSARAALPETQRRGFTMGAGVRAGRVDPAFVAWVQQGLLAPSDLSRGFAAALASASNTQAARADDGGGIPKPVLIAGGVVAALGLVALAVKYA